MKKILLLSTFPVMMGKRPYFTPVSYVVTMGDSVAGGQGASDAAHRWINLIQAKVNAAGNTAALVNDSIGGQQMAQLAGRLFIKERRGLICILPTFNDAFNGISVESFTNNLHALIRYYDPVANLICVGSLAWTKTFYGQQAMYLTHNAAIPGIVSQYPNVLYAPVYEYMNQNDSLIDVDNIHPNDAGHQKICDAFWSVLRRYFAPGRPVYARPKQTLPVCPVANCEMDTAWIDTYNYYLTTMSLDAAHHLPDTRSSLKMVIPHTEAVGVIWNECLWGYVHPAWGPNTPTQIQAWVKADDSTPSVVMTIGAQQFDAANTMIAGTDIYVPSPYYTVTNAAWTLMEMTFTTEATCRGIRINVTLWGADSIAYVGRIRAFATSPVAWTI